MPKVPPLETAMMIAVLGGIAGWLVFIDPQSTLLTLIVGGFLGALNMSPQKKDPSQ